MVIPQWEIVRDGGGDRNARRAGRMYLGQAQLFDLDGDR
jgi:hypothetical protein